MAALKAACVDADYFLLDSDYGHAASGRDWAKWAPRLRRVHGESGLVVVASEAKQSTYPLAAPWIASSLRFSQ